MPLLPEIFRRSSAATANYDWIDFISRAGYKTFYGACSYLTGGLAYFLTTNVIDSSTGTAAAPGFYTLTVGVGGIDLDFDVTFNVPVILAAAETIINVTVRKAADPHIQATATVYHVTAAGVETSLGTATAVEHTDAGAGYYRECFKIALTSKGFKAGEKLRLNIVLANTNANANATYIYHDPTSSVTAADINSRTIGTDITFDVPFKVNI